MMHREAKATTPKRVLGSRGDDGENPSVFRFFPMRVSSIAAISLDAILGSTDVAFLV